MTITLEHTYLESTTRKQQIEQQLEELEQKLRSPQRTVEDIVRHIQLLKEYQLQK